MKWASPSRDGFIEYFYVLGVILGGAVPVILVAALDGACRLYSWKCEFVPDETVGVFWITAVLFTFFTLTSYVLLSDIFTKETTRKHAVLATAIVSFIALFALVYSTGGGLSSVFSFHYLYIPTVVASHTYFPRKVVVFTAGCYGAGFIGHIWMAWMGYAPAPTPTAAYYGAYGGIFLLQLFLAMVLTRIGKKIFEASKAVNEEEASAKDHE